MKSSIGKQHFAENLLFLVWLLNHFDFILNFEYSSLFRILYYYEGSFFRYYIYDPVDISSLRHVASVRLWLAGSFGALSHRRLCNKKKERKKVFLNYTIPLCVVVVCERKSSRPRLKIQQGTATGVMFLLVGPKILFAASHSLSLSLSLFLSVTVGRRIIPVISSTETYSLWVGTSRSSVSCKSRDYYAGYLFLL